jgi:hypothetical protein
MWQSLWKITTPNVPANPAPVLPCPAMLSWTDPAVVLNTYWTGPANAGAAKMHNAPTIPNNLIPSNLLSFPGSMALQDYAPGLLTDALGL